MKPGFFIPSGEFRSPLLQMRPHQVTELADLLLRVKFGPEIHEVEKGSKAEAHNEMLAVVERQDAAGVFFGEA